MPIFSILDFPTVTMMAANPIERFNGDGDGLVKNGIEKQHERKELLLLLGSSEAAKAVVQSHHKVRTMGVVVFT